MRADWKLTWFYCCAATYKDSDDSSQKLICETILKSFNNSTQYNRSENWKQKTVGHQAINRVSDRRTQSTLWIWGYHRMLVDLIGPLDRRHSEPNTHQIYKYVCFVYIIVLSTTSVACGPCWIVSFLQKYIQTPNSAEIIKILITSSYQTSPTAFLGNYSK